MITAADGTISHVLPAEDPLSADVGIVRGERYIWLFDAGCGEGPLNDVLSLGGPFNAVISHFHPDHMANLDRIPVDGLYVGKNTFGYTHRGTVVEKDLYIEDGHVFHIFPLPSTHAKGSLGLEVDGRYAFVGDGFGPNVKKGRVCYNAGLLKEGLAVLKRLEADTVILSHREEYLKDKAEFLAGMEEILAGWDKSSPYIFMDQWR